MPRSDRPAPPVVESNSTTEAADPILHALHHRVRQQEILAELGVGALQGPGFDQLLEDTARLTAEGLRTEFCKVLQYIPAENRLLVRAGVGWEPGVVGVASIGADLASPAGFALKTGRPVISNHLENEERFRTPELLLEHGIHRAMNVILQGDGQPFGVLEVDSRSEDEFVEHDLAFLQGAANILGMAIERERHERNLKAALERQQFLVKEMNHRVKNSLALVVGMLRLQGRENSNPEFAQHLEDATLRVGAIARVHEQLYQSADVERFDVGRYIEAICIDLSASFAQCDIHVQAQAGIIISTDRAISSALIVNELVSNAAKHAYQGQDAGNVWVNIATTDVDSFFIAIRDEGGGLAEGFQFGKGKGLGARMVRALAEQLNASLEIVAHNPGVEFVVTAPLAP
ncbi:MAG TPA: histidine kinase dimerization/phosphoacceptor domain -containing protein [Roseiarcus sp.]